MELPADVRALFEAPNYAHLATILPGGAPHTVPVWAGIDDGKIAFLTSPNSRKARNLAADPRVAISVTDRNQPYAMALVRGRVTARLEGEPGLGHHRPHLAQVHRPALPAARRQGGLSDRARARPRPGFRLTVTPAVRPQHVFGFSAEGAAQAELAVLSYYAPIPPSLDFPGAAALPAAIETATRALGQLGVGSGSTLLINGASGSVGSAAVQLAVVRGARVIGTASPANHDYLRSLGAEPVAYGEGLAGRVRALAPDGVDAALDVAGSGVLPELIELAGGPEHVMTIADFGGAQQHGVRFSSGDAGRAVHALAEIGELIESGRFSLPVAQTFPLTEIAEAHRVSEDGHVHGKLVLVVGSPMCGRPRPQRERRAGPGALGTQLPGLLRTGGRSLA